MDGTVRAPRTPADYVEAYRTRLLDALDALRARDAMTTPPIIDTSCDCDRCVSRTTAMYDLPGRCGNCGTRFTVRSRKGDSPPLHVTCPGCGCWAWGWRDQSALRAHIEETP